MLAPHTDDGEFGCGGTIAKMVEAGTYVQYVAFSAAEDSLPPGVPRDVLRSEVMSATKALGLSDEQVRVLRYPVRRFLEYRQEILEDMIGIQKSIRPSMVLCPTLHDVHQDHAVVSAEALRAFKNGTILGYEMPWNNLTINTSAFVVLNSQHVECKLRALGCYMSQRFRSYIEPDFIRCLARVRGAQIKAEYAEVFEVIRVVFR